MNTIPEFSDKIITASENIPTAKDIFYSHLKYFSDISLINENIPAAATVFTLQAKNSPSLEYSRENILTFYAAVFIHVAIIYLHRLCASILCSKNVKFKYCCPRKCYLKILFCLHNFLWVKCLKQCISTNIIIAI